MQLLATSQVYAKPLDNLGACMEERFLNFVGQILKVSQDK